MVIRIPRQMDDGIARRMNAEVFTMKFIHSLGIPVPEILEWDSSRENDIDTPFIVMSRVKGASHTDFQVLISRMQPF